MYSNVTDQTNLLYHMTNENDQVATVSLKLHYTKIVGNMLPDKTPTILQQVGNNFTTSGQRLPHHNILTCQEVGLWHCHSTTML